MIRRRPMLAATALLALTVTASTSAVTAQDEPLNVFGAYATQIEEPWDGVIHTALQAEEDAGRIVYDFADDIGYSGDMEFVLREVSELDAARHHLRRRLRQRGSRPRRGGRLSRHRLRLRLRRRPGQPQLQRLRQLDPRARLPGRHARRRPDRERRHRRRRRHARARGQPHHQRLHPGAQSVNPEVEAKVSFINSWFDPASAKEAALAQIDAGADVLYAERAGVIEAAVQEGLIAVGNMSDQSADGPDNVVTSVTWNMTPTVEYIIDQVAGGTYTAQDLKDFSMVAKGGAALAPINEALVPPTCSRRSRPRRPRSSAACSASTSTRPRPQAR